MTRNSDRHAGVLSSARAHDAATGLGWFGIGLGLVQLLAPRAVARTLGMPGSEAVLQAYGLRGIVTGVGILSSQNPAPWIWGRVAGDALDAATLTSGLVGHNRHRENVGMALAAVAAVSALDVVTAKALDDAEADHKRERRRRRWYAMVRYFGQRSGFPNNAANMRGKAADFAVPDDFRIPELLRPWVNGKPATAAAPPVF